MLENINKAYRQEQAMNLLDAFWKFLESNKSEIKDYSECSKDRRFEVGAFFMKSEYAREKIKQIKEGI